MKHLMPLLATLLLLAACSSINPTSEPAKSPIYIVSGDNVGSMFPHNALTIVDPATWTTRRQIALPHSWAKNVSRDPQGRLWIGFSGNHQDTDNLLRVYTAQGDLLRELRPCEAPEAGISFAANRAFVACAERGFSGKVVAVNMDTLVIEASVELSAPNSHLILTASAASDAAVVVAGMTSGPEAALYSVITVIDPRTLTIRAQLTPGKNTNIWQVIPYQGRFYLLNVASGNQPRAQANDLLVLDPSNPPTLTPRAVVASPLWGVISGDSLYAYHNPTWGFINTDQRMVSRYDLISGQVQTWALPKQWNVGDITVIDGQIVLVKWDARDDAADGLYRFDPISGALTQLINVADASRLVGSL